MDEPKTTHIKTKKLCLANGDEYDKAEFDMTDEMLERYTKVIADGKTVYINPDFMISFELDNRPSVISSCRRF